MKDAKEHLKNKFLNLNLERFTELVRSNKHNPFPDKEWVVDAIALAKTGEYTTKQIAFIVDKQPACVRMMFSRLCRQDSYAREAWNADRRVTSATAQHSSDAFSAQLPGV